MGERGEVSETLAALIDKHIAKSEKYLSPRAIIQRFEIARKDGVLSIGGVILEGKSIAKFLEGCDECHLMCVTVGYEVEREIERASASPLEQLVIDAIGTAAVESAAEEAQASVGGGARFSPGYGDFPLEVQPEIIRLLDTTKYIGVRVTKELLLTPRKSVTAVIKK